MKLYVIDNETKAVHQVGTDSHDALLIDENGGIQYYNLQCGCGTNTFGRYNPTYSFCNSKGEIPEFEEFAAAKVLEFETDTENYASLIIQTIRMLKRWDLLLGHDGSNTKAMVRNDIQYLLKELERGADV